jgi:hypothetical protein
MSARKGTPISDPFMQRMQATSKGFWNSVDTTTNDPAFKSNWMPPAAPPQVIIHVEETRSKDYDVGYNLSQNPLYGRGGVTIAQLRALADNYEVMRGIIENTKNQITTMGGDFHLKDLTKLTPDQAKSQSESDPNIKKCREFFKLPDGRRSAKRWIRMILEEMLVTDFLCIFNHKNKLGDPLFARLIDCQTIVKKIDNTGEVPFPPSVAYQQIIKGVVTRDFTSDDLFVFHRNPRVHDYFGFSQVEMVVHIVNIGLRRSNFQMSYYTEGNIPDMILRVTEKWTDEQVAKYQKYFDLMMSGDSGRRRRVKFVPDGVGEAIYPQKDALKDEFDEWVARVISYVFGVTPNGFIKNVNRATGEQQREQNDEEGKLTRLADIKEIFDYIIEYWLGITNVEWVWIPNRSEDSLKQNEIDVEDVRNGIRSRDEVRAARGLHPIGIGCTVSTSHGVVSLIPSEKDHVEESKTLIETNDLSTDNKSTADKKVAST